MAGVEDTMLPVRRVEVASDDIDVVTATISQLYARHRPRIRRIAHSPVDGTLRAAVAGPLNAGLIRQLGIGYTAEADPVDWLLSTVVLHGAATVTTAREQADVARGDVILYPLGTPFAVDLRFESMAAVSAAARGLFTQAATFICGELVTSGATTVSPLVVQELTRLAASAMLTADPAAGHTVAATARRWGFSRPDRFAAAYRTVYGRPPSHILRR